ncbi:hypothetical protein LOD99_8521 [Oopsacas minuta]|uniref:Uncharacterized protein n=1 Tax=Oopsacas minuta TaxID=111878 RepID=A0AAV7JG72_9METZ|nr:hypothetical protein LOD99_8521 [Oopsacas minuta]
MKRNTLKKKRQTLLSSFLPKATSITSPSETTIYNSVPTASKVADISCDDLDDQHVIGGAFEVHIKNFEKLFPILQDDSMLPNVLPSVEYKDDRRRFLKKEWLKIYPWMKLNGDLNTCHCAVCYWAI